MAKKKKVKKVKHVCEGDCTNCPNFGTKNCEMYANKYKGKKKRKKKEEIRGKIIDSSLRTLLKGKRKS